MTYTKKTTENLRRLAALSDERNGITPDMYTEHAVFRGLRDMSGNGVVTGLTEISTIKAKEKAPDGSVHTCPGELYYRGYNICDLVGGFSSENRFGFEETAYLLLFSSLPDKKELQRFEKMLAEFRSLPKSFVRDMIMKAPGRDVMNILSRCVSLKMKLRLLLQMEAALRVERPASMSFSRLRTRQKRALIF